MKRTASAVIYLALSALALSMIGCGASGDETSSMGANKPTDSTPVIEEPDLYRQFGDYLYVQNPQTGLNILEVKDTKKPRLLGRAKVTGGAGAEIYVRGNQAVVLLKSATSQCRSPKKLDPKGWTLSAELAIVDVKSKTHPKILERYCLPGTLVANRIVDHILYAVTTQTGRGSRAISINLADPSNASVVQQLEFPDASKEIKVTPTSIYVAGRVIGNSNRTRVGYITITSSGKMTPRGTIELTGAPMGRFHMDPHGHMFRIVTYDANRRETFLSVLDMSNPDKPRLMGQLGEIGRWERLYATRFDGDYAYVVTFRQTDPLWIVSLKDPTRPKIVGELHVPGWSDFIFVRGDSLITVGRGNGGSYLGVSLFDISDRTKPRSLSQIQLGDPSATSEANVDHRGVTILEGSGKLNPVVVVPYTKVHYGQSCTVNNYLRLVEVQPTKLKARGEVKQQGTIRRSLTINGELYSISDYEVLAVDIANLDKPLVDTSVTIGTDPKSGDSKYNNYCNYYGHGMDYVDDSFNGPFEFMCSMDTTGKRTRDQSTQVPPLTVLVGIGWLVLRLRRRPS